MTPSSDALRERIILVTGAGDGIGYYASKAFAAAGATVILMGRKIPKLEKLYDEIVADGSPEPAIYPLHMEGANNDDYLDFAKTIEDNFGRLDGILHNAAAVGELTPLSDHAIDLWLKTFQVNLHAPFMLTQACLPVLQASDKGCVLFTDHQGAAAADATYWGAYGVSKAAVVNLALKLGNESKGDIRFNVINPGPVASPMRARAYPGEDIQQHPQIEELLPRYIELLSKDCALNGEYVEALDR